MAEQSPDKANTRGQTKAGEEESLYTTYSDLESSFVANIGNWKKLRRQDNKDIYKCAECESKLQVEKKGAQFKVRVINPSNGETHNWFDKAHLAPFVISENSKEEMSSERLHSSVEAFIKLHLKNNEKELEAP